MTVITSRRGIAALLSAVCASVLFAMATGCSAQTPAADTSSIEEATDTAMPEPLGAVSSVTELQGAFITAGGDCEGELEDINRVTAALGSGVCTSSGTVLTIYIDHDAAKNATESTMALLDRIGSTMILGENWAINPSGADRADAARLTTELGGQLLEAEATPVRSLEEAFTIDQAAQAYDEADGTTCSSPVDMGDNQPVLECADLTLIVKTNSYLDTESERQEVAKELDLDYGGVPIVGPRHIVVVYDSAIDVDAVARQIAGTTRSA